jgi:hypothetical protein
MAISRPNPNSHEQLSRNLPRREICIHNYSHLSIWTDWFYYVFKRCECGHIRYYASFYGIIVVPYFALCILLIIPHERLVFLTSTQYRRTVAPSRSIPDGMQLKYYTSKLHSAAFVLPGEWRERWLTLILLFTTAKLIFCYLFISAVFASRRLYRSTEELTAGGLPVPPLLRQVS